MKNIVIPTLIILSYLLIIFPYVGLVFSSLALYLLHIEGKKPQESKINVKMLVLLKTLGLFSFFINAIFVLLLLIMLVQGYFTKEIVSAFI